MIKIDKKYLIKALEKKIIKINEDDYSYDFFSKLTVLKNKSKTVEGVDLSHYFFVGIKVESNGTYAKHIFNLKGEHIASTSKITPNDLESIDVFDLSYALSSSVLEDPSIISSIPIEFIKAYPSFKSLVQLRLQNDTMGKCSTATGVDRAKYDQKMKEYDKTVVLKIEEILKK